MDWDFVTRGVKVNSVPGGIKVHEFDHKGINEVIYDENGVVIRSISARIRIERLVSFASRLNAQSYSKRRDHSSSR